MALLDELLNILPDGNVLEVCIGLHWTATVVEMDGAWRCGLASTLVGDHAHGIADVPQAGELETLGASELAAFARSEQPTLASVGFATINALMPPQPRSWVDANASEVIARHGVDKTVVLIGHFPFIPDLGTRVGELYVLEKNPGENELPAEAAPDILPRADVVAITSMTLLNGTFQDLLALCSPDALVLLLGPSTPLSPVLFDHGVDLLSGSVVTEIEPVLWAIRQGANFRQVHRAGVRLVTMCRPGLAE
jgi:uncharacterized protein (DUF4213/DUF364 family)